MDKAITLARLRALQVVSPPVDRHEIDALRAAAHTAGRRLIEVTTADGQTGIVAGWLHDSPLAIDERGGPPGTSEGAVLVLAACVRLCWPDPDKPLLPGTVTTVADIKASLSNLGVHQVTGALNRLSACGYLRLDQTGTAVWLGPAIGLWRAEDVALLQREYATLPGPQGTRP
ncbi:hypothetical protein [Nocardia sp. XZ_19_231]|uniref:hypothetical protein n=1 Tax=Nocardia sp. XZ_19_231 TaxID=2769252 RepID=UPI00188E4FB7|nr:hypothetical protein [Nocardia sp. XZ_19_231]